ncbi:hypothetical protein CRUP_024573 [Coryphaenoides rupestris]|nr:hypothetical protein CRUP_024573 [Coryphaenoides rupestris]
MSANLSSPDLNGAPGGVPDRHNYPALVLGVVLIVVIMCGNVLVCVSVWTEKALKTTTNYFIVSLAVVDLLLALLVLPLFIYSEVRNTSETLMFIAVAVPLAYNRRRVDQRQAVLPVATWVLALAVAAPVMLGINNMPGRDPTECKLENDQYVLYSSVCSFFIPCPITLLLYCAMFRELRRWEEARKMKLRSSIRACQKLRGSAGSLPSPPPPIRERDPPDRVVEEAGSRYPASDCKGGPGPAGTASQIRFTANPNKKKKKKKKEKKKKKKKKKRAKITGRERKASLIL